MPRIREINGWVDDDDEPDISAKSHAEDSVKRYECIGECVSALVVVHREIYGTYIAVLSTPRYRKLLTSTFYGVIKRALESSGIRLKILEMSLSDSLIAPRRKIPRDETTRGIR